LAVATWIAGIEVNCNKFRAKSVLTGGPAFLDRVSLLDKLVEVRDTPALSKTPGLAEFFFGPFCFGPWLVFFSTGLGESCKRIESHGFADVASAIRHAETVVLAVAAAHFSFVCPEVNSKYNVTEDVRASVKALIDVVEETDVGVEVGDAPANLVFAPVSSASLFVAF
jgi:hypothetical protein